MRVIGVNNEGGVPRVYLLVSARDIAAKAIVRKPDSISQRKSQGHRDGCACEILVFQIDSAPNIDDEAQPIRLDISHCIIDRIGVCVWSLEVAMN